jgi:hypothetical protein
MDATSRPFPESLREALGLVIARDPSIVYPDERTTLHTGRAVEAWMFLVQEIPRLSKDSQDAVDTVKKQNRGAGRDSFLQFWKERPAAHHADMAEAANVVRAAMANSWNVVVGFQNAMIKELGALQRYINDNRRYSWASGLPRVTSRGTRRQNAEEHTEISCKNLCRFRNLALEKIGEYATDLDKAKKKFDDICHDVYKREGFHWEGNPDGSDLIPPKLGIPGYE